MTPVPDPYGLPFNVPPEVPTVTAPADLDQIHGLVQAFERTIHERGWGGSPVIGNVFTVQTPPDCGHVGCQPDLIVGVIKIPAAMWAKVKGHAAPMLAALANTPHKRTVSTLWVGAILSTEVDWNTSPVWQSDPNHHGTRSRRAYAAIAAGIHAGRLVGVERFELIDKPHLCHDTTTAQRAEHAANGSHLEPDLAALLNLAHVTNRARTAGMN